MKPGILLVDDEKAIRELFSRYLSKAGYEIHTVSMLAEAREALAANHYDVVLLDMKLPDGDGLDWVGELRETLPNAAVVIITGYGDIPVAVEAMRRGADQFLTKPVNLADLEVFLRKGIELETLRRGSLIRRRLAKKEPAPYFGQNPKMKTVVEMVNTAARNNATVLMLGETGVGKGMLARWIHEHSPQSAAPFVELNCSSLKGDLLASELFGHVRGAFTSAVEDKQGLIEVANGGTLFLDEIGDMDIGVQAQFLNFIESKRYRRLGEVKIRASEFRLVCATNHDLKEQCQLGRFRQDLYFRINVFPVEVPPLREIKDDVPGLVHHFLKELIPHEVEVAPQLMQLLTDCSWPGNIRELRNVLERAVILAGGKPLTADHFPGLSFNAVPPAGKKSEVMNLEDLELAQIKSAMARFGNDTKKAADALGISRATLYRRLKDAGIK